MKVNALLKDYIINSRIGHSNDIKESIVWFTKDTLKPYITTSQVQTAGKIQGAFSRKFMQNGDTFEVFQTPYTSLQVYKSKNGKTEKILLKDCKDKSKRQVEENAIDSFKSALKFINKDFFSSL